MYKDVARRVLAVILTICMAVTVPDATLLAVTADREDVSTEAGYEEQEVSTETNQEETEQEAEITGETGQTEEAEETESETETESEAELKTAVPFSGVDEDAGVAAVSGEEPATKQLGELEYTSTSKPLPNQLRDTLTASPVGKIIGLEIKDGDYVLQQGVDYTVDVEWIGTNQSEARILVTAAGDKYRGELPPYTAKVGADIATRLSAKIQNFADPDNPFEINAASGNITYKYTGGKIQPEVLEVSREGIPLSSNDYDYEYKENLNAGEGGIIIRGQGNYAGEAELKFTIEPETVNRLFRISVKNPDNTVKYDKAAATSPEGVVPDLEIVYRNSDEPVRKEDYTLVYGDNKNQTNGSDTAYVRVEPGTSGNCIAGGSTQADYIIAQADLSDDDIRVEVVGTHSYTGTQITPSIRVYQGEALLAEGSNADYNTPTYGANINAGEGTITITGRGNYKGTVTKTFEIKKFNLGDMPDNEDPMKPLTGKTYEYNGSAIEPPVTEAGNGNADQIVYGRRIFRRGTDYTVSYANNTNPGRGWIVFEAMGSNCIGSKHIEFTIWKNINKDYGGKGVEIDPIEELQYTGTEQKPVPVVKDAGSELRAGEDTYGIAYDTNDTYTDVGSHNVQIKFDGKYYRGSDAVTPSDPSVNIKTVEFKIVPRKSGTLEAVFTEGDGTYTYTGSAPDLKYAVRIKGGNIVLPAGDFTIDYGTPNNTPPVNAGEYTAKIVPTSAAAAKYEMEAGRDIELTYIIDPKPIDKYSIQLEGADSYTGIYNDATPLEPTVTVLDENNSQVPAENYEKVYRNNINAGKAVVEVTGKGNYKGTITKEFTIAPKDLGSYAAGAVELVIASDTYTYTGESVVPDIETLKFGSRTIIEEGRTIAPGEITVESAAVNAGTGYTFTIRGQGNYTGSLESSASQIKGGPVVFQIEPRDIGGTDVIVEDLLKNDENETREMLRNQVYDNGNEVRPVPRLTYNGRTLTPPGGDADTAPDYQLAYANNTQKTKDTGELSVVTISGQGNFKGTRTVYFRICENIASVTVGALDHTSYLYSSRPCRPMPTGELTMDGQMLVWGEDYDIVWKNNVDAIGMITDLPALEGKGRNGKALVFSDIDFSRVENPPVVEIIGLGDYGGTKEMPFVIEPVQMELASAGQLKAPLKLRIGSAPMFTGSFVTPTLTIQYAATDPNTNEGFTYDLVEGQDYDFLPSVQNNIDAGAGYQLVIRAKGNFTYSRTTNLPNITLPNYVIKAKPINSTEIKIEILDDLENIGLPATPKFRVIDTMRDASGAKVKEGETGTYELKPGVDYRLGYDKNKAPGQALIQVQGIKNYSGKDTEPFIIPGNLSNATITFTDSQDGSYLFTGSEIKPKIRVEYPDDAGNAIVLKEGTDFTYTVVGDNINSGGEPKIHLEGKSAAYAGQTKEQSFTINPRPLDDSAVRVNLPASVNYDEGRNVEPSPTLVLLRYTLIRDTDYTCTYENPCALPSAANNNKKYKVTIRAKGSNFTGEVVKEYTIGNNFDVTIRFKDNNTTSYSATYTGEAITPELIVIDNKNSNELVKGKDYDVSYSDNINAGKAVMITVYGLAGLEDENHVPYDTEYCGNRTITFEIKPIELSDTSKIKIAPIEEAFTYNASARTPKPVVTWDGHGELEEGTDFAYGYFNNMDAGRASVVINAASNRNFTGTSAEIPFTINPKNLSDEDVVLEGIPDHVYTGEAIDPKVTLRWQNEEGQLLEVPEDGYTAKSLGDNINVGTVEVEITGKGNFTGSYKVPDGSEGGSSLVNPQFRIVKVKMSDVTAEYEKEAQYTGKQITPAVTLTYLSTAGETITMNSPDLWGYTITYGSNQALGSNSGTITVTPSPSGNCEGSELVLHFAIVKRHINDETISMEGIEETYTFDAEKETCEPKPVLTFKPDANTSYVLREGYDYVVEYTDNDKVTQNAKIIVKGIGNFDSSREQTFAIIKNLVDYINTAELDDAALVYNGKTQHPELKIDFKLNTIEEGRDYELVWDEDLDEDCVSAGEHTLRIKGKGEYSGQLELPFTIQQRDISNVVFTVEDQPYTGSAIEPVLSGMDTEVNEETPVGGDVYEIVGITDNTEVGTATITIAAVEGSNYTGTAEITFQIIRANLEDKSYISVSPIDPQQAYTGEEIRPEIVITDSRRKADGTAQLARDGECYTLQEGIDYEVTYTNNIYPRLLEEGELPATVTITGINHYEGTVTQIFDIVADLALAEIDPIPAQEYKDGEAVTPPLTVRLGGRTLKEGFDFDVTYANNTERGVATATITAKEGTFYTGSQTVSFNISRELTNAEIRLIDTAFTYTGSEIRPTAAVVLEGTVLTEGTDYEISYKNNVNVGTAEVIVTGIGGYDGGCSTTFTIIKRSIIRCEFGGVVNKVYDGSATTQNITVKEGSRSLVLNQDYAVSYAGNTAPGIATVTITGLGNYGGTKTIRYQISVGDMTQIRAKGSTNKVTLSWSAVAGAQGYVVYDAEYNVIGRTTGLSYTHKNLRAVTTYTYNVRPYVTVEKNTYFGRFSNTVQAKTSVAKPVVKVKAYKKKIRVSWKRIKGVSGYEIYRSTKKTKGYKKIKTAKKGNIVSYTNKSLKSKKRYYYKVRAYKNVNGKKVYSKYSSPKSVKAK